MEALIDVFYNQKYCHREAGIRANRNRRHFYA